MYHAIDYLRSRQRVFEDLEHVDNQDAMEGDEPGSTDDSAGEPDYINEVERLFRLHE